MLDKLIERLKTDEENWQTFQHFFRTISVPPKTVLLKEGEIADNLYFVKSGCLRIWFNNDGKDVTTQFFFEEQPVASIESFIGRQPSLFSLESIEQSELIAISKEHFDILLNRYSNFKDGFMEYIFRRLTNYATLFLSRIKDTPQQRYEDLIKNKPEIIQRVPQHYIASYLGITPISLSRIRNRR